MQLWTMKENYSIQSSLTALMVLQAHQDWMQVLGKEFAPLSSTTWSPWVTVYLWLRSSSAQGRLMAIDKQPAVCPIAIGEVLRCIIVRQSCLWWSPMSWLYLWAGLELWSCCACHANHPWRWEYRGYTSCRRKECIRSPEEATCFIQHPSHLLLQYSLTCTGKMQTCMYKMKQWFPERVLCKEILLQ